MDEKTDTIEFDQIIEKGLALNKFPSNFQIIAT